ncbi:HisA/HisF-related TIM barrel protein [Legionella tunisiensis]
MLSKRIIPCLDVHDNKVVKGVKFRNHRIIGDILPLATRYSEQGADELVFMTLQQAVIDEVFAPTGSIKLPQQSIFLLLWQAGSAIWKQRKPFLHAGADKLSINSPALENPDLINQLSNEFGSQCIVIGIDSQWVEGDFYVYQYTGDESKSKNSRRKTLDWVQEVQARGAGEIVLNCMQADGVRAGYDLTQLQQIRQLSEVPLIASGGAGKTDDFVQVFLRTEVAGALAASVFHDNILSITEVKQQLAANNIEVRL